MTTTAVIAFDGWNDAAESATSVIDHLMSTFTTIEGAPTDARRISAQPYVDLQVNRPQVEIGEDRIPRIVWPDVEIRPLEAPEGQGPLIVVIGPEPSHAWVDFCNELLDKLQALGAERIVVLGAMLAEVPHTRPIPVRAADPLAPVPEGTDVYEGPVGIPTVFAQSAASRGLEVATLWAQVPHYVGQAPSPKAALALVRALSAEIDIVIPLEGLEEEADAWQRGVDELAQSDEEIGAYVARLEQSQDAAGLPEASGDAIAAEFEQFLRRRDQK